jgi:PAS domain S-box-containing protein
MNHRQPTGQTKGTGLRLASVAKMALILSAMLAWSMVDQAMAQAVGGSAGKRPALFLGNESLPPMNFTKNGKPTGIVIDLAEALVERMHRPVEIRLMNWAEAQQLVLEGRADALLQINPSPERLKVYDFSEPLLTSEFTIFTSAERFGVASMRDLRGLKVGVEKMGLPILLLQEDPQIIVEIIPDFVQGFRMLATGAVDAVVADRWVGSYVLAENNIRGVKFIEEPVSRSHSTIAVKKGNTNLLGDINAGLADIRRDGTYDRIIQSWRAKEVVFRTREQLRQQAWLLAAISAALIAALVGAAALVREIRRRKRVEATLQESEEKYRSLFNQSVEGIYLHDLEGRILDVNQMACLQLGYSRDELLELSVFDLNSDKENTANLSRDEILRQWKRWQPERRLTLEAEYRHKDGTVVPVEISAGVIRYGDRNLILAIVQDISVRKQAEHELERVVRELRSSLAEIKTLRGIVPICSHCKKIRDDEGFWSQVEAYFSKHTDAKFSHGICPECRKKLYPGFSKD